MILLQFILMFPPTNYKLVRGVKHEEASSVIVHGSGPDTY